MHSSTRRSRQRHTNEVVHCDVHYSHLQTFGGLLGMVREMNLMSEADAEGTMHAPPFQKGFDY